MRKQYLIEIIIAKMSDYERINMTEQFPGLQFVLQVIIVMVAPHLSYCFPNLFNETIRNNTPRIFVDSQIWLCSVRDWKRESNNGELQTLFLKLVQIFGRGWNWGTMSFRTLPPPFEYTTMLLGSPIFFCFCNWFRKKLI